MGGVSQGQTLSQAATAAGGLPDAGITTALPDATPVAEPISTGGIPVEAQGDIPLDQVSSSPTDSGITTPLPDTTPIAEPISGAIDQTIQEAPSWDVEADMSADPSLMTDSGLLGGEDVPSEVGLLSQIQESTNTRFNNLMDGFVDNMDGTNLGPSVSNYFMSDTPQSTMMQQFQQHAQGITEPGFMDAQAAGFGPNKVIPGSTSPVTSPVTPSVPQTVTPDVSSTVPYGGANPYQFGSAQYSMPSVIPGGDALAVNNPALPGMIMNMGKKAWGFYKKMWDDNPGMAMWTTANVIKTIAALLDKSDEEESYRKRHVMGFAPGNWSDLRKKYGGNVPTSKKSGYWAGEGMRTASAKTGPKPAGGSRTSAIDRKPQGLVGSKNQGALT
jgi:hypothetical protein